MTQRLKVDGVTISDAATRVLVDGVEAIVKVDGLEVYAYNPPAPPIITGSSAMPDAVVGTPYYYSPTNTGGAATSWSSTALPDGLVINTSTGRITGTPTTDDTGVSITITATNDGGSSGFTDTININLAVSPPNITTSDAFASSRVGEAFSWTPTNTGGAPTSYVLHLGVLPSGLTLNPLTGAITGTPTAIQSQVITIRALNSAGTSDFSGTITVSRDVVAPPFTFLSQVFASGVCSITFNTTGGYTTVANANANPTGNYLNPGSGSGANYEIYVDSGFPIDEDGSESYSGTFDTWEPLSSTAYIAVFCLATPGLSHAWQTSISIREIANPSNIATFDMTLEIVRP